MTHILRTQIKHEPLYNRVKVKTLYSCMIWLTEFEQYFREGAINISRGSLFFRGAVLRFSPFVGEGGIE